MGNQRKSRREANKENPGGLPSNLSAPNRMPLSSRPIPLHDSTVRANRDVLGEIQSAHQHLETTDKGKQREQPVLSETDQRLEMEEEDAAIPVYPIYGSTQTRPRSKMRCYEDPQNALRSGSNFRQDGVDTEEGAISESDVEEDIENQSDEEVDSLEAGESDDSEMDLEDLRSKRTKEQPARQYPHIHHTYDNFQSSKKLHNHLGVSDMPTSINTPANILLRRKRAAQYLRAAEEEVYGQLCLIAPDLRNNRYLVRASRCFADVRPQVLELFRNVEKYKYCGYVFFFCEFASFSSMRNNENGPCLYMMSDCACLKELRDDIQTIVSKHRDGAMLDVIVQKGTPKLHGVDNVGRKFKSRVSTMFRRKPKPTESVAGSQMSPDERQRSEFYGDDGYRYSPTPGYDGGAEESESSNDSDSDGEDEAAHELSTRSAYGTNIEVGQETGSPSNGNDPAYFSDSASIAASSSGISHAILYEGLTAPATSSVSLPYISDPGYESYGGPALDGLSVDGRASVAVSDAGSTGTFGPENLAHYTQSERSMRRTDGSVHFEIYESTDEDEMYSSPLRTFISGDDSNKENIPPGWTPPRAPTPPTPPLRQPMYISNLRSTALADAKHQNRQPLTESFAPNGAQFVEPGRFKTSKSLGYDVDHRGFHFGMRYITQLPEGTTGNGEGVLVEYHQRPNIGESICHADDDWCSGTLAGYLVDRLGTRYAMTAFHVMRANTSLHKPLQDNTNKGAYVTAPAINDFAASLTSMQHLEAGILAEYYRSAHFQDGRILEHINQEGVDLTGKVLKYYDNGNREKHVNIAYGRVAASAWGIRNHPSLGNCLVDMAVIKPFQDRIGRNTFTYRGRDNEPGKRYRLEANGWAKPVLGGSILKVGRSTGLTRGTIISTEADMRVGVGPDTNRKRKRWEDQEYYFYEVRCHVATAGGQPWFSESGDSGSWILQARSEEQMKTFEKEDPLLPIPVPVVGLLFGGADSVEGVHLTFFNSSELVKSELKRITGVDLTPGIYPAHWKYNPRDFVVNNKVPPIPGLRADQPRGLWSADHSIRRNVKFSESVKNYPPWDPSGSPSPRPPPFESKLDGRKKGPNEPREGNSEYKSVRSRTPSPRTPTPTPTPQNGRRNAIDKGTQKRATPNKVQMQQDLPPAATKFSSAKRAARAKKQPESPRKQTGPLCDEEDNNTSTQPKATKRTKPKK